MVTQVLHCPACQGTDIVQYGKTCGSRKLITIEIMSLPDLSVPKT
jgi:hypothetical protein